MNLLPKSSEEFSSKRYWDAFFSKRKEDPFEWYGEYPELAGLLHKYVSPKDKLLIVGCGNSTLSHDLHSVGIRNQVSLDISPIVVSQMRSKYPQVEFVEGDVTQLTFEDNTFSCVLDKGTFDALSPPPLSVKKGGRVADDEQDPADSLTKVDLMMKEVSRTLKAGGRFICISLLQPHVASRMLSHFYDQGWMVRVVRCLEAEEKTAAKASDDKSVVFPVFMSIFTKLNLPQGVAPLLEASSTGNTSPMTRFKSLQDLLGFIKEQQNFALVQRGLDRLGFCAESGIQLRLSNAVTGSDRFILNIVDAPKLLNNLPAQKFGVFVVPEGREAEWMFGTHEGRLSLAVQANFTRLVVVHLIRGQTYTDMNSVQEEIRGPLSALYPSCIKDKNIKAPIMTVGSDIGNRTIVQQGTSDFSGDYVIEDVTCDGQILRRLIFLNNPNVIQSEVEISIVKQRGKELRRPVTGKLSCQHHGRMTLSIGLLNYFFGDVEVKQDPISVLLIGLGGGLLASFLLNFFPHLVLSVVELDPAIVTVAQNHFGLPEIKGRLSVEVEDGLKFIQSTESQYNIILIDVDNKSTKEGLSCPPPDFIDPVNLERFRKIMDLSRSILVINLACRNEALKKTSIAKIQQSFPLILHCDVPDECNTILYCFPVLPSTNFNSKDVSSHVSSACKLIFRGNNDTDEPTKHNKKTSQAKMKTLPNLIDLSSAGITDVNLLARSFKVLKV